MLSNTYINVTIAVILSPKWSLSVIQKLRYIIKLRCDQVRKKGVASRHGYTFGTEETNFFRYLGPLGRHLAGQTFWTQINLRDIDQVPDY